MVDMPKEKPEQAAPSHTEIDFPFGAPPGLVVRRAGAAAMQSETGFSSVGVPHVAQAPRLRGVDPRDITPDWQPFETDIALFDSRGPEDDIERQEVNDALADIVDRHMWHDDTAALLVDSYTVGDPPMQTVFESVRRQRYVEDEATGTQSFIDTVITTTDEGRMFVDVDYDDVPYNLPFQRNRQQSTYHRYEAAADGTVYRSILNKQSDLPIDGPLAKVPVGRAEIQRLQRILDESDIVPVTAYQLLDEAETEPIYAQQELPQTPEEVNEQARVAAKLFAKFYNDYGKFIREKAERQLINTRDLVYETVTSADNQHTARRALSLERPLGVNAAAPVATIETRWDLGDSTSYLDELLQQPHLQSEFLVSRDWLAAYEGQLNTHHSVTYTIRGGALIKDRHTLVYDAQGLLVRNHAPLSEPCTIDEFRRLRNFFVGGREEM